MTSQKIEDFFPSDSTDDDLTEEVQDLTRFTLPHQHRPGTDLISKAVLKNERAKNIVISALLGENIGHLYAVGDCEWNNNTRSDILYVSFVTDSNAFPPILIEVQHTVDVTFMSRAITYCVSVRNTHKRPPILLVIAVKGVTKEVWDDFEASATHPCMKQISCKIWASSAYLICSDSIDDYINEKPLRPMTAFSLFFTKQKQSLLGLRQRGDPTLQIFCQIAKERFEDVCGKEESGIDILMNVCDQMECQLKKIKACNNDPSEKVKRGLLHYVDDGIDYLKLCRRKYRHTERSESVTPMEPLQDIPSTLAGPSQEREFVDQLPAFDEQHISFDAERVDRFRDGLNDSQFTWKKCFSEGRRQGYYARYKNADSLKAAYNRYKSKDVGS